MQIPENKVIFHTKLVMMWTEDKDFLYAVTKPGVEPTVDNMEEINAILVEIAGGKKYHVLVEVSDAPRGKNDVVEYAQKKLFKYIKALAVTGRTQAGTSMVNAVSAHYKLPFPFKMFADTAEAKAWLQKQQEVKGF